MIFLISMDSPELASLIKIHTDQQDMIQELEAANSSKDIMHELIYAMKGAGRASRYTYAVGAILQHT